MKRVSLAAKMLIGAFAFGLASSSIGVHAQTSIRRDQQCIYLSAQGGIFYVLARAYPRQRIEEIAANMAYGPNGEVYRGSEHAEEILRSLADSAFDAAKNGKSQSQFEAEIKDQCAANE